MHTQSNKKSSHSHTSSIKQKQSTHVRADTSNTKHNHAVPTIRKQGNITSSHTAHHKYITYYNNTGQHTLTHQSINVKVRAKQPASKHISFIIIQPQAHSNNRDTISQKHLRLHISASSTLTHDTNTTDTFSTLTIITEAARSGTDTQQGHPDQQIQKVTQHVTQQTHTSNTFITHQTAQ